ncbi:ATPase, F1 complex, gamma subunit domain-containing protein [Chytridium lagenaria]|nr:ATPase, F1 complex, gamma subunit domain-containing protein [Chytridium lagenaria]
MIASTKVNKAQKNMETARAYGSAGIALFKHAETPDALTKPVVVACSSDRGLCGGIHSSISKGVKRYVATVPEAPIAILGLKARNQIQREYRANIAITFDQVAKNIPTWFEASIIATTFSLPVSRLTISAYEVDDEILKNFQEFTPANSIFWGVSERTAMENATKNAGEMITKLTLTYNRSRQAAITNELIDIITGASAM